MRRRRRSPKEINFNFNSFLDLVANVVGIIIRLMLVAWVGAKAYTGVVKQSTPTPLPEFPAAVAGQPEPELSTEPERKTLEDVRRMLDRARTDLLARLEEQHRVAQQKQQSERLLADAAKRSAETETKVALADQRRQQAQKESDQAELSLAELRRRTEQMARELNALNEQPAEKQTLHYQTPVARVLQSEELQFECMAGRVSFLDVEAALREIRRELRGKGDELRTRWQVESETQPLGAFRFRYAVVRERGLLDNVAGTRAPDANSNYSYGVEGWVAVPILAERGETSDRALQEEAEFRRIVDRLDPAQTAITFWVYPDSFALYRRLRDYLVARDFLVAGRPLPEGAPIASSRQGTASRGQ